MSIVNIRQIHMMNVVTTTTSSCLHTVRFVHVHSPFIFVYIDIHRLRTSMYTHNVQMPSRVCRVSFTAGGDFLRLYHTYIGTSFVYYYELIFKSAL